MSRFSHNRVFIQVYDDRHAINQRIFRDHGERMVKFHRNPITANRRNLCVGEISDRVQISRIVAGWVAALRLAAVASACNNPALETTQQVPSGYNEVVAVAGSVVDPGQNSCPLALPLVPADAAAIFTSDGVYVPGVGGVTTSAPSEERNDWLLGSGSCFAAINGIQSTSLGGGFSRIIPIPGNPSEAAGTSFAAPHVAGVVARIIQTGMVSAAPPVDGAGVEDIRDHIRNTADRRAVSPPDPLEPPPAPLNNPMAPLVVLGYSPDGDFEGIAQAPR
jgi:subtilisin family serine protease